jgi:hypothetical protein
MLPAVLFLELPAIVPNPRAYSNVVSRAATLRVSDSAREENFDLQEGFGSSIPLKAANTLRIGFQNIGGFSTKNNSLKDDIINSGLKLWEFDIFGIAETNINW